MNAPYLPIRIRLENMTRRPARNRWLMPALLTALALQSVAIAALIFTR